MAVPLLPVIVAGPMNFWPGFGETVEEKTYVPPERQIVAPCGAFAAAVLTFGTGVQDCANAV
jgi:hypothetical protein